MPGNHDPGVEKREGVNPPGTLVNCAEPGWFQSAMLQSSLLKFVSRVFDGFRLAEKYRVSF